MEMELPSVELSFINMFIKQAYCRCFHYIFSISDKGVVAHVEVELISLLIEFLYFFWYFYLFVFEIKVFVLEIFQDFDLWV